MLALFLTCSALLAAFIGRCELHPITEHVYNMKKHVNMFKNMLKKVTNYRIMYLMGKYKNNIIYPKCL